MTRLIYFFITLLAISNSAEAYPKKPEEGHPQELEKEHPKKPEEEHPKKPEEEHPKKLEEEHPKKLEEEHPQEKQICFEGTFFQCMVSEDLLGFAQGLDKYLTSITGKNESIEYKLALAANGNPLAALQYFWEKLETFFLYAHRSNYYLANKSIDEVLSLMTKGNSNVFSPETSKKMALENFWVAQLEVEDWSPYKWEPNWKPSVNPSVKSKNLRKIFLTGQFFVQSLADLARGWDSPNKKELYLYKPKECSLRSLDKMTNTQVTIIYYMDERIRVNELDYLSRLIKAPTEPEALRRSVTFKIIVKNPVVPGRYYRIFEDDPYEKSQFRTYEKNLFEISCWGNSSRSAFWKIIEALKRKNKNRMEEE